ncbi:MAG: hypothetical protein KAR20_07505, partial [Candidatus Heimdallarchaeota archaeon]|nr:hypothetical protein [Candidatus Heimdallarchaeota archaeon]
MYAPSPIKEKITPVVRENFLKLAEGFKFLKITRWIYIIITVCVSLRMFINKIFFGPFFGWFAESEQTSYANYPIGFLLIGIIIISVPRLWGNINFIVHLKRTARNMNDTNINRASRHQITRIFLYALNVFLLILLVIYLFSGLDMYYRRIFLSPDLARIFLDITRYNVIIGIDGTIISIITFYGIFALLEKRANYLTWNEFNLWVQNQMTHVEETRNSQSVQKIRTGSAIMKYGVLMMIIESLLGNIVFNIGISKMEQGFKNYPNSEIYRNPIPIPISIQRRVYPDQFTQHNYTKRSHHPIQETRYGATQTGSFKTTTPATQTLQTVSNYCGYCGEKIETRE